MKFFDKIRDIFSEKEEQEVKKEITHIELSSWIEENQKNHEAKIKKIREEFTESVKQKLLLLEEANEALKNQNLEEKREEDRIKKIVLDNKRNYTQAINFLINSINDSINSPVLEEVPKKISSTLQEFSQKTVKSHSRANYLIGKEIGDIEEILKIIYDLSKNFLKDNSKTLERDHKLSDINSIINQRGDLEKTIQTLKKDKTESEKKLEALKINKANRERELELIKNSKEYLQNRKKSSEKERLEEELKQNLNSLKSMIDLKELAKKFHTIEKKMELIKEYRSNFQTAFNQDKEKEILNLITTLPQRQVLEEKIKEAFEKKESLDNFSIPNNPDTEIRKEITRLIEEKEELKGIILNTEKNIKKTTDKVENINKNILTKANALI